MMRPLLAAWVLIACEVTVVAAEKTAAELLPPTAIAYVELPRPAELIATVLDHPLRPKLEGVSAYQKAIQSPAYRRFLEGVDALEKKSGMTYRAAVESLTAGGIYFGVDALTQGAVTLVKAKDAATLEKLVPIALEMGREEARRQGKDDAIPSADYKGVKVYQTGEARWAAVGSWLVIANKDTTLKQMVDRVQGAAGDCLAEETSFKSARATISGKPCVWAYVNVSVLRTVGVGKELFAPKSDNPAGELLVGGLLSSLAQTPFVTASIDVERDRVAAGVAMPHDVAWTPKTRQYYFGAASQGLEAKDTLLSLSTYRDVGGFWLLKEDLFTENIIAQMTQADSNLTTLLSGKDFGRDILGAVGPEMQFIVARQTYEGGDLPVPEIKLPAGALVLRLKEPEKMQRPLKVLFQSLVGFLNIVGSQQGQPALEQDTEKLPNGQLVSSRYIPAGAEAKINYNFSPSVAFAGDRLIVSSAASLARELAAAQDRPAPDKTDNTRVSVNLSTLRDLLNDNRKHLVAQAAINDGSSKEDAEKGVDELLSLLAFGKSLGLRLSTVDGQIKLEADVKLSAP